MKRKTILYAITLLLFIIFAVIVMAAPKVVPTDKGWSFPSSQTCVNEEPIKHLRCDFDVCYSKERIIYYALWDEVVITTKTEQYLLTNELLSDWIWRYYNE